jgi:hypothetical protein
MNIIWSKVRLLIPESINKFQEIVTSFIHFLTMMRFFFISHI